jgi:tetratricopeptide (TPR) repeat protein
MRVGLVLSDLARYAEAREALIRFINLRENDCPLHALPYVWMGDTYRRAGDRTGAQSWYRRAIETDPADCEGYNALGQLMLKTGRITEAIQYSRQSTQCKNACADAWFWRGVAHRTREEFSEAVKCCNRALAIDSEIEEARHILEDTRAVIRASEWDPLAGLSHSEANWRMNENWDDGKPTNNVLLAKEFLAEFPENYAVWTSLAKELTTLCRYAEAREALDTAINLRHEQRGTIWYGLPYQMGRLYRRMGDYPTADQWYRKAIIANPENAGPWIFRGALHAVWGQFEIAKNMHRRGTQCEEGVPDEAWYNLGLILRAQERFEEAANCFKRALAIDPEYEIAKEALCDVMAARDWRRGEMSSL